jgi:microcin C transport system substrate-binding protein
MKELMVESLLISKRFVFFVSIFTLFFISSCDKKSSRKTVKIRITEAELMEKYRSKDLTEEQVDSIVESIKWTTNTNPIILGDKKAKKGGTVIFGYGSSYPPTLRTYGENSNELINQLITSITYETLLKIDPLTYKYLPGLADKWSISEDKMTYFFHINEKANWQDGFPVSAFDVVATYDLLIDEGIRDPYYNDFYSSRYERPVALTPDIVMVNAKLLQWSSFLYFSNDTYILPEHIIARITPSQYLTKYNNEMMPGSGPYSFEEAIPNQVIILKRDTSWWAANNPLNKNLFNFDEIKINFYTDETVLFENFKKGNVDIAPYIYEHIINKWVEDFSPEKSNAVKNNYIIRQKIHCGKPAEHGGFAFNIREQPFDDIRLRKAICLLLNRKKLINKLFFDEYKYMDSYYSNSIYENKNNPKIRYNPEEALRLLEEAGYSQKNLNDEGYIVKDGKPFELNLNFYRSDDTRIETLLQEELKKVGIKINLKKVTWAKHIKDIDERNFKMIWINYTTDLFPYPEHAYHSKYADKPNTTNIYGFKNKKVDELCEEYNLEFDFDKRVEPIQELDSILVSNYLMALNWFSEDTKILYWNKFGTPDFVISGVSYSGKITFRFIEVIATFWWADERADRALQEAKGKNIMLPGKPSEVREWEKLKKRYK